VDGTITDPTTKAPAKSKTLKRPGTAENKKKGDGCGGNETMGQLDGIIWKPLLFPTHLPCSFHQE